MFVEQMFDIEGLKKQKNAVILSHNYQILPIQTIADSVGDSLELSMAARDVEADIIVFCGVDFMAETAAILNPNKKVLVPSTEARCPMAAQLNADMVRKAKEKYNAPFVAYVNTHASVKAVADVCCTSANVARVVENIDSETVLLGPDANLAWYAAEKTGKEVIPVPEYGNCCVHQSFTVKDVERARIEHPEAEIIVHPECRPEVQRFADFVGSTSQMIRYVAESGKNGIIIGTEIGLIERLVDEHPGKEIFPLRTSVCSAMKKNTLDGVVKVLREENNVVRVDEKIAVRARKAIERMFELC
ncbi:quinolinate synthase NadA [Archaeoglobus neptunius]|uniref:quinolinate synthase NadA n=1 Tax=Archaeoglobus neptunius TaxID=2798580 RepID=UPI0019285505|nr:quinolinate synthase NadA [Archaeoglobus neptunius]